MNHAAQPAPLNRKRLGSGIGGLAPKRQRVTSPLDYDRFIPRRSSDTATVFELLPVAEETDAVQCSPIDDGIAGSGRVSICPVYSSLLDGVAIVHPERALLSFCCRPLSSAPPAKRQRLDVPLYRVPTIDGRLLCSEFPESRRTICMHLLGIRDNVFKYISQGDRQRHEGTKHDCMDWGRNDRLLIARDGDKCTELRRGSWRLCLLENQGLLVKNIVFSRSSPSHIAISWEGEKVSIIVRSRENLLSACLASRTTRATAMDWRGTTLYIGYESGVVSVHDIEETPHPRCMFITKTKAGPGDAVRSLRWSCDSTWMATGHESGQVLVWSSVCMNRFTMAAIHAGPVTALAWSPLKKCLLATAGQSENDTLCVFDVSTRQCIGKAEACSPVLDLLWSKNSPELLTCHGGSCPRVVLWNTRCLSPMMSFPSNYGPVRSCRLSPDGQVVAFLSDRTIVRKMFPPAPRYPKLAQGLALLSIR